MRPFCFLLSFFVISAYANGIKYIHPLPSSRLHSPATTIIVRFENSSSMDPHDVLFEVTGSSSGTHQGVTILSSDGETYIFKPANPFAAGETVDVTITAAKLNVHYSSTFIISPTSVELSSSADDENEDADTPTSTQTVRIVNGVSLPSDFPQLEIRRHAATDSGFIFVSSTAYSMILNNDGAPCFYRKCLGQSKLWDFTVQANGLLTLMEGATAKVFDRQFELLDQYKCGHGYKTDYHEFRLTPEGHVLLIAEDIQKIDMSQLVVGGKSNASVVGNHLQELDGEKNVIFEWRSWDHYDILDAVHETLTKLTIHPVHFNAIDIDYDGDLLVCCRHMDEIVKIDRDTGDIIWRFGGRHNEFDFVNDAERFSYPHDIRAVPGVPNHYTLFDNGNFHTPQYSRAVEYALDVNDRTAEKVWEYRHSPDRYSYWMGNVDRLANGNTAIGWSHTSLPKYTEVTAAGEIIYEMDFAIPTTTYRAHRHQWRGSARRPYLLAEAGSEAVTLIFNQFGADVEYYNIYADTTAHPTSFIDSTRQPFIQLSDLVNEKTYYFRVTSVDSTGAESDFSDQVELYVRLLKPGENQIKNGGFSQGLVSWRLDRNSLESADWDVDDAEQLVVMIYETTGEADDVSVSQRRITLLQDRTYELSFDALADSHRPLEVCVMDDLGTIDYSELGLLQLTMQQQHYHYQFIMRDESDDAARLFFKMGDMTGDVHLDNIYLSQVVEDAIKENSDDIKYRLYANYPNPFNAYTTIHYAIAKESEVEIKVFDLLGRVVHARQWRHLQAGEHSYRFDARGLSSGIYFYQIIARNGGTIRFTGRSKLMLIK
ncbi:aryl-sulfate sulfotransferase [candidate division KSB1 bacterium]|nr:aryl-sulfate sulfotransferase [candidate division KSB1 bacterium]